MILNNTKPVRISAVRYGRVPKRSKSTDEQRVTTTDNQEQSALESKQLAIYDVILTISQAHHGNSVLTEDKVKAMVRKPVSLVSIVLEFSLSLFLPVIDPLMLKSS